jgi:hypothetical protein
MSKIVLDILKLFDSTFKVEIAIPPKRHMLGSNHIFWYVIRLGLTFGPGCRRVAEKKNTQNRYISPIRGEAPS